MKRKMLAWGVVALIAIYVFFFCPIPLLVLPAKIVPVDFVNWYFLAKFGIDLPEFKLIKPPEVDIEKKIIFTNFPLYEEGEIYIVDPNKRIGALFLKDWRIVEYPGNDVEWNPDEKKIIFLGPIIESKLGNTIYAAEAIGNERGKITRLVSFEKKFVEGISISPGGRYIAFTAQEVEGSLDNLIGRGRSAYVMDLKTGIVRKIAKGVPAGTPRWSSDGRLVMALSGGIFIVNFFENKSVLVRRGGGCPNWAPEGKIVFVEYFKDEEGILIPQIFLINPDGSEETQLTHFSQKDFGTNFSSKNPGYLWITKLSYSPDGRKIVFAIQIKKSYQGIVTLEEQRKLERREIYILDADGSNLSKLAEGFSFTWTG